MINKNIITHLFALFIIAVIFFIPQNVYAHGGVGSAMAGVQSFVLYGASSIFIFVALMMLLSYFGGEPKKEKIIPSILVTLATAQRLFIPELNFTTFILIIVFIVFSVLQIIILVEKRRQRTFSLTAFILLVSGIILLNSKVIDWNNYILTNNNPLHNSHKIAEVDDVEFKHRNNNALFSLGDGRIFIRNGYRNERTHLKVDEIVDVEQLKNDVYWIHMSKPIYKRQVVKALFNVPLFDKEIDGYKRAKFDTASMLKSKHGFGSATTLGRVLCNAIGGNESFYLIKALLKNGAAAISKDRDCFVAAVSTGKLKVIRLLNKYRSISPLYSDKNLAQNHNKEFIERSIEYVVNRFHNKSVEYYTEIFSILASAGADINIRNKEGLTPLGVIRARPSREEDRRILKKYGSVPYRPHIEDGENAEIVLIRLGATE